MTFPFLKGNQQMEAWIKKVISKVNEYGADISVLPEYAWGKKPIKIEEIKNILDTLPKHPPLVFGTGIIKENGKIHNMAIVVNTENEIQLIPKFSPMAHERERGIKGKENVKIFETQKGIRYGVVICADLWQYMTIKRLTSVGIDILIVPAMTVTLPNHEYYAKFQWYSLTLTRSREFVIPIVVSDHPGLENVTTGFASSIVDPSVKNEKIKRLEDFFVLPNRDGIVQGELDFDKIKNYREYRKREGMLNN